MPNRLQQAVASPRLRRRLMLVGLVVAAVWFAFFDSHSLVQRIQYYSEAHTLSTENARLQAENGTLQRALEAGLSDEVVEKVAREQYGMRRAGETVYRVSDAEDGE